jgi:hypothetical protein
MRRGILLPEKQKRPRFIWYPTDVYEPDSWEDSNDSYDEVEFDDMFNIPEFDPVKGMELAELQDLLNEGHESWSTIRSSGVVLGSFGGGLHLDHTIYAAYRDAFRLDGSDTNQCLDYLTRGRSASHWRGPLLLHGMTKVADSAHCIDLGASDLTIGVEGILKYMKQKGGPRKIRGVKVNPSPPYLEEVWVPIQHPIFSVGAQPSVSKKTHLPLRTYLYSSNNAITTATAASKSPRTLASLPSRHRRL